MNKLNRHPVVYAGLLSVVAFGAPVSAHAAAAVEQSAGSEPNLVVPFILGAASGAAVTALISFAVSHAHRGEEAERAMSAAMHAAPARPVVAAEIDDDEPTASVRVPRHAAGSQPASAPAPVAAETAAPSLSFLDSLDDVSEADDYTQVAMNYVQRETFLSRLSSRAKGVAQVLSERVGSDMMDGMPVIKRADGSVGDVGTSWWNETQAGAPQAKPMPTAPGAPATSVVTSVKDGIVYEHVNVVNPDTAAASRVSAEKAASIAERLSNIDDSVYPEVRNEPSAASRKDVWEKALSALDERMTEDFGPMVPFSDVVGTFDTLEEPDGLDPVTAFIPFRTPAGHPEVVDTNSYVDYLIDDEFSQNSSRAVRRNAREYLHVIEGGSQNFTPTAALAKQQRGKHFRVSPENTGEYRPRHMRVEVAARQA